MNPRREKLRYSIVNLLMLLGACGLVVAGLVYSDAWFGSRRAVADFKAAQTEVIETSPAVSPGTAGNIVISAHRDSFLRPLKDIRIGDVIELELRDGMQRFKDGETFITDPLDVSVLEPTETPTLTLITGWAQQMTETELSCQEFRPTEEALRRFPDLVGACEAVVDRDGELYGRFAIARRRCSRGGPNFGACPAQKRTENASAND